MKTKYAEYVKYAIKYAKYVHTPQAYTHTLFLYDSNKEYYQICMKICRICT